MSVCVEMGFVCVCVCVCVGGMELIGSHCCPPPESASYQTQSCYVTGSLGTREWAPRCGSRCM